MQERLHRSKHDQKAYSFSSKDPIEIHIEKHCWQRMHGWCQAANTEVGGNGLAKWEGNIIRVYDVFLPKQYCTGAYTELDDRANSKLQGKLMDRGQNMDDFRFWWHTHYNFNTFWSGTDDDNAQRLLRMNESWQLSLVINQKESWLARLDLMKPVNITIDELQVYLIPSSKKVKRKRNFAADIAKWVKPYSEIPEHQKNNFAKSSDVKIEAHKAKSAGNTTNEEPKTTGYAGHNYGGHMSSYHDMGWMNQFRSRFSEGQYEKKHEDPSKINYPDTEEKKEDLPDMVKLKSGHILYKGVLMSEAYYDTLIAQEMAKKEAETKVGCPCNHDGVWETCTCLRECEACYQITLNMGH